MVSLNASLSVVAEDSRLLHWYAYS